MGEDSMGGGLMRGRRPEKLIIARRDQDALHCAAHSGSLPWFQVQRAKIVLAAVIVRPVTVRMLQAPRHG